MIDSQVRLFLQVRDFSRVGVILGLLLVNEFTRTLINLDLSVQVGIALIALIIGIPHGAVDHLLSVPKLLSLKMAGFLIGYLLVTGLAIWFMLEVPLLGFQIIVLLSAIHFGIGDASFYMELFQRMGIQRFPRLLYALAAGSTPVVIPLVSKQTANTLQTVNPELVDWAGGYSQIILWLCIGTNLTVVSFLLIKKYYSPAIDLLILLAVAYFAPPLVAFALYFGLWHAMRHTARLTLEYVPAVKRHESGKSKASFWIAVRAGLPAVAIVLAFTVALAFSQVDISSDAILWYLLVVTWALTVPHMVLTAKSDVRALQI